MVHVVSHLLSMLASSPFVMCREGGIGEQECSICSPRMIFPQIQYIRRSNKIETMSKQHECSRKHDPAYMFQVITDKGANPCHQLLILPVRRSTSTEQVFFLS
jgi:hypothetical protein